MTDEEFFGLVKRMRSAQKRYFKTHDFKTDLPAARQLEAAVDREIDARDRGPELFAPDMPTTAPGTAVASTPCRCGEHTGGGRCGLCDEHTKGGIK